MTGHLPDTLTLVADIGGTNTRVALARGAEVLPETVRRYPNVAHPGLGAILGAFLAETGVDCAAACVAIAGPVRDGRGTMTNLDWTVDEASLARSSRAERVAVLNDLQAQGHALGHIPAASLLPVMEGTAADPSAAQLVIGIGTGFNVAPVHHLPWGRFVAAAEAGHGNLPIRSEAELRLCRFVETAHGFPAIEDVLSGRGLSHVYAWLGVEAGDPREAQSHDIIAHADSDPRAAEALKVFATILGRVAGNFALEYLPFGGIYLAGGMARATAPFLAGNGFAEAFREKGRFSGFMRQFPVAVIDDDFAALTGCAAHMAGLASRSGG